MRRVVGDFQGVFFWILAGFFAVGGIVSSMFHELGNALAEFGIATIIMLLILLKRLKR